MNEEQPADRRVFLKSASTAAAAGMFGLAGPDTTAAAHGPARRRPQGLAELEADDFTGLVGSRFGVETAPGRFMAVELIEVNRLADHGKPGFRKPFSLVFRVPGETRLGQDVYRVRHRGVGTMPALLAPVDLPSRYNHLETVFA